MSVPNQSGHDSSYAITKLLFSERGGNTFSDHGMRWDNSGKNGHYANTKAKHGLNFHPRLLEWLSAGIMSASPRKRT
jgi:hypothetical protein